MYISKGFIAQEQGLSFYNGKAVIDLAFTFLYDDDEETVFDFIGYVSAYMYIYDERSEQLLKSFTNQLTRNSNVIVMNTSVSDMAFEDTVLFRLLSLFHLVKTLCHNLRF